MINFFFNYKIKIEIKTTSIRISLICFCFLYFFFFLLKVLKNDGLSDHTVWSVIALLSDDKKSSAVNRNLTCVINN